MWCIILALQSSGAVHLGVDNLGVVRHVGRLVDDRRGHTAFELVKGGDLLLLIERMLQLRGLITARVTEVKGHADEGMVLDGRVREIDSWAMTLLMRLLILGVGELVLLSLMLVVIYLGFLVTGTLSFLTFIGFSLPYLVQWSIMVVEMVLLLILLSGLLVLFVNSVGWFLRFVTVPFCLGP